jgi:hypothetical protein
MLWKTIIYLKAPRQGHPPPVFNFIDEAPKKSNDACTKSLSDVENNSVIPLDWTPQICETFANLSSELRTLRHQQQEIKEAPKESNGECTKSLPDLQTLFFEIMDPEITFQESVDWTSRHSKMTWADALTKELLDLKEIEKSGKWRDGSVALNHDRITNLSEIKLQWVYT